MPLPNTGMSFTPFDPLPASDLNDLVANVESLADGTGINSNGISSHITTYSNPGSAGGTFYYVNYGGLKLFWGTTATQTIGGAAPTSAPVDITFPVGFFSAVRSAIATPGPSGNTPYTHNSTASISTAGWAINFSITVGSAGIFNANVFVIGT